MTTRDPSRTIPIASLCLGLALAPTACATAIVPSPAASGSASPSAAVATASAAVAEPIPSPLPSKPPPKDAVAPFLAVFTSQHFVAQAAVTGDLTVNTVSYPITGTMGIDGADNHQALTIAIPGAPQVTESIKVNGVTYDKHGQSWFEKPASKPGATSDPDLATSLHAVLDLADIGVEMKDGRPLHHLAQRPGAAIPVSAIGMADPRGTGTVTVDFYVQEDGTPVLMDLTAVWTQVTGATSAPASMTIDLAFSNVGGSVVIAAPDVIWKTFTSKRYQYAIAYPAEWDPLQSSGNKKPDTFQSADNTGVLVYRYPTAGSTLNAIASAYVTGIKHDSKAKIASSVPAKVDGLQARRIEWTATYRGTPAWFIDALVVRGKNIYLIEYTSLAKPTDADRALFDAFVASVGFKP